MKSEDMIKNLSNGKIGKEVQGEIEKHLKQGKTTLIRLEKELNTKKQQFNSLKKKFDAYEEKVSNYIEKNPKKALTMAVAAGVLATALWSSFNKKK